MADSVLPGDPFYSRDWNDALRRIDNASRVTGKGVKASSTPGGTTLRVPQEARGFAEPAIIAQAYNKSGGNLKMFQPVAITGQTGDSSQSRRILTVEIPTDADVGRWAICAAPIGEDKVGRVYIGGMCLAMLENPDSLLKCEIEDGGDTLIGDEDGSAQIFWEDAGDPADPHLALIRFPFGGAGSTDFQVADIASTANLTLSGSSGTIDGVAKAGKIILAKNQTTAADRGLYQAPASGTGAWTFLDQPKVVEVLLGTANGRTRWLLTSANTYQGGVDYLG